MEDYYYFWLGKGELAFAEIKVRNVNVVLRRCELEQILRLEVLVLDSTVFQSFAHRNDALPKTPRWPLFKDPCILEEDQVRDYGAD